MAVRDGSGEEPPLLALVGPTAEGKTGAGIAVAELLCAEIVSVDSMLVYRGMDVGTAKPTAAQRARVPHHLLDVAEPSEPFSVARYQELAREAIAGIRGRGRRVLLVGGSALYERAVVDELGFPGTDAGTRKGLEAEAAVVGAAGLHGRLAASDPAAAARIEPGNVRRTVRALEVAQLTGQPFSSFAGGWETYEAHRVRAAGISMPSPVLRARIETRVAEMLERGWLDEVRGLVERGFGSWLTSAQAIGYAELARHLAGELTLDAAVAGTVKRTRALARRQLAFFRRDPRIRWFEAGEAGAEPLVEDVVAYLSWQAWETADG
jgi:tRNA dimethylallyltransferase